MIPQKLQDKTIVVVGAAGLLGRVIVEKILQTGAKVIALDTNAQGLEHLKSSHGNTHLHHALVDMTDRASIERILAHAHTKFGSVDGAVNTAYPRNAQYGQHFFDVEYNDFCENTAMHLGGYFLFMQSCARYALEKETVFSLVNLSSVYGSMTPRFEVYSDTSMTMPIEYAAIKAGIEHMTRYINAYMKGKSAFFRANCISPGGIFNKQDERFLTHYTEHCVGKGMLDASDVTGSIVFLLSDASRYIVGQNLIVDDGFSV